MKERLRTGNVTQLRKPFRYVLLPILSLFLLLLAPSIAQGIALTGNFSHQNFVLSPGETSADIDAYVIVINTGDISNRVKINTQVPQGVTLTVDEYDFVLEAGAQKRLDVVVQIDAQAILGEYTIGISAESYVEGEGIKVTGGGLQRASLNIVKPPSLLLPILGGTMGGLALIAVIVFVVRRKTR